MERSILSTGLPLLRKLFDRQSGIFSEAFQWLFFGFSVPPLSAIDLPARFSDNLSCGPLLQFFHPRRFR